MENPGISTMDFQSSMLLSTIILFPRQYYESGQEHRSSIDVPGILHGTIGMCQHSANGKYKLGKDVSANKYTTYHISVHSRLWRSSAHPDVSKVNNL